ncbi:MAG TPA: hypothetical protein VGO11_07825 [Chthoniobacteraceae bacterium]|jgi:hypothetical protein|nr:hypothetical protein [Chthoniobacteraceae bacterium]
MLDSYALFNLWAPPDSLWTPWVKPVLLAHLQPVDDQLPPDPPRVEVKWAPLADGRTAIVCDREGATSVATGLALAERGYQPVLLCNGLPSPAPQPGSAVVDVSSILAALADASPALAALTLPITAPPAFLLDEWRHSDFLGEGQFDNRSLSFASDFPSAALLLGAGISHVLLVREASLTPQSDLAPTLYAWQQAGIAISAVALMKDEVPQPIQVSKPSFFNWLFLKLIAPLQLEGNARRGYGGFVPHSG